MKHKEIPELQMKQNLLGKIAQLFVDRYQLTLLLILMITTLGLLSIVALPKESLPEIVFPTITVQTIYPGASPVDVEALVTDKIEAKLAGVDDLDTMSSQSNFGLSLITLTFIEGTDMERKKLELQNELADVNLPEVVDDPSVRIFKSSELPIMRFSVSGDYSIFALTNIAKDIAEGLEGVNGVEEVQLFGGLDRQIDVIVNQTKLLEYGLTQADVENAISGLNVGFPVGELDLSGQRYSIRIDEQVQSVSQLDQVVLNLPRGGTIFLSEVAQVVDTSETLEQYNRSFVRVQSGGASYPSILVEVVREKGGDVLGTSNNIRTYLDNARGRVYPQNIQVFISDDEADDVQRDLDNVQVSAFAGLIVVVIVLYLFIGFREALIVSITIPMSLLITLALLNVFGITLNTFAVLGMIVALGLLVDNSIIVMENMDRLKNKGLNSRQAALVGTNQVGVPILASTLTTVAAFLPLAILPGIVGAFINTIPRTIMIALVASLWISITVTPAVYSKLMSKQYFQRLSQWTWIKWLLKALTFGLVVFLSYIAFYDGPETTNLASAAAAFFGLLVLVKLLRKERQGASGAIGRYQIAIQWVIGKWWRKALVLLLGLAVLLGSFTTFASGQLKVSFFPSQEPTSIQVTVDTPGGSTLEETAYVASLAEQVLKDNPHVASYNMTIGGNEIDLARFTASFVDDDERTVSGFEITEAIQEEMTLIPGAQILVAGSAGGGPPVGRPIGIDLIGDDLVAAQGLADQYVTILNTIPGVYNVETSVKEGVPTVLMDIQERKAQTLGLSVAYIARQLRGKVEGNLVTTIKEGGSELNVVIKQDDFTWTDVQSLNGLTIQSPTGAMIPLETVVTLKEVTGISSIAHEERERIVTVAADLREGFNATEAVAVFNQAAGQVPVPDGIFVSQGGDIEGIQENFANLLQSMFLAVFLVFIILTLQFKSISQPFAILLTVPMAMIGVIWGLVATGNEFGFYAFMGLVALVGIAVNDAIVLIDYMNYLRSIGKSLPEAIVEASGTRFNPVLATTMTTIGGVLPLAFKDVYYAQFSFSLVFGLLVTTFMTLVFIPVIYSMIEGSKKQGQVVQEPEEPLFNVTPATAKE